MEKCHDCRNYRRCCFSWFTAEIDHLMILMNEQIRYRLMVFLMIYFCVVFSIATLTQIWYDHDFWRNHSLDISDEFTDGEFTFGDFSRWCLWWCFTNDDFPEIRSRSPVNRSSKRTTSPWPLEPTTNHWDQRQFDWCGNGPRKHVTDVHGYTGPEHKPPQAIARTMCDSTGKN